ncbi:MAG: hypothetical protein H8E60_11075 [Candidatus Marinimicrobia bacterium]|nr:hypothetical protein [Candidatus Neomarinimicrobiota bacterium]
MEDKILPINYSPNSIVKIASIISNAVMLAANTYLLASNIKNSINSRRQSRISENLQLTADVSSAVGGIVKVITDVSEKNDAQSTTDL